MSGLVTDKRIFCMAQIKKLPPLLTELRHET